MSGFSDEQKNSLTSSSDLGWGQLRDLRDQLRRPLTGRVVLIPIGEKAFIPGKLSPQCDAEGREQVTLLSSGYSNQVSREDALEKLQVEIGQTMHSNRKQRLVRAKPPLVTNQTPSKQNQPSVSIPYFEIREEFDSLGKEVKAEAIDISRHVDFLRNNSDAVHSESLAPNSTIDHHHQPVTKEEIPVRELKSISNDEFDTLSARLEELARLEEAEGEIHQEVVAKKAKSVGWSKGFLNKNAKPTPVELQKRMNTTLNGENLPAKAQPWLSQAYRNTSKKSSSISFQSSAFSDLVQERSQNTTVIKTPFSSPGITSNRVRFDANQNEVKEIPRIGQIPVSSIQRPSFQRFTGADTETDESRQPKPKKKLSKFALERQQMRR